MGLLEKTMNQLYQNSITMSTNINKITQELAGKIEALEVRIADLETAATKDKVSGKNLSYMKNHN